MISFTAYANRKFEILRRHGCVISRESVKSAVRDAMDAQATGQSLFFVQKNDGCGNTVRVAYRKEAGVVRIITFYPVARNE